MNSEGIVMQSHTAQRRANFQQTFKIKNMIALENLIKAWLDNYVNFNRMSMN